MVGGPLKVTWTREDDIRHDYYHAICAQHLEAGLDQDGRAGAWLHRTVFPPIEATFQPNVVYGSGGGPHIREFGSEIRAGETACCSNESTDAGSPSGSGKEESETTCGREAGEMPVACASCASAA